MHSPVQRKYPLNAVRGVRYSLFDCISYAAGNEQHSSRGGHTPV